MHPVSEKEYIPCTDWIPVKQAAAQLGGVSNKLIYRLYHLGELEGAKIGGTVRIRTASVAAYLAAHSNRKTPPEEPAGFVPQAEAASPTPKRRRRRREDDFTEFYRREMERIYRKRR